MVEKKSQKNAKTKANNKESNNVITSNKPQDRSKGSLLRAQTCSSWKAWFCHAFHDAIEIDECSFCEANRDEFGHPRAR